VDVHSTPVHQLVLEIYNSALSRTQKHAWRSTQDGDPTSGGISVQSVAEIEQLAERIRALHVRQRPDAMADITRLGQTNVLAKLVGPLYEAEALHAYDASSYLLAAITQETGQRVLNLRLDLDALTDLRHQAADLISQIRTGRVRRRELGGALQLAVRGASRQRFPEPRIVNLAKGRPFQSAAEALISNAFGEHHSTGELAFSVLSSLELAGEPMIADRFFSTTHPSGEVLSLRGTNHGPDTIAAAFQRASEEWSLINDSCVVDDPSQQLGKEA
jgi:hypothetical protein